MDHVATSPHIAGHALAFFAFDIGFQVDLDAAELVVREAVRQRVVRARPAPVWFDYSPPPLRLTVEGDSIEVGERTVEAMAELLIYDFGAAVVTYRLPVSGVLDDLPVLATELFEHAGLIADARRRVADVLEAIRPAVERPRLAEAFEDYTVFSITSWEDGLSPAEMLAAHREVVARAIEGEQIALSGEQIGRATEATMAYAETDLAVVDWNATILFDAEPGDVISLLQHANVELLELRILDLELDNILDHADETMATLTSSRLWPVFAGSSLLRRFASVQTDAAVMFEGVNNAIKLLGNQYLARLYRLAAGRLDLPAWQASVQRKLEATESIYQKMSDSTATRRLEVLEWVIIILIAVSIILPLTPWY